MPPFPLLLLLLPFPFPPLPFPAFPLPPVLSRSMARLIFMHPFMPPIPLPFEPLPYEPLPRKACSSFVKGEDSTGDRVGYLVGRLAGVFSFSAALPRSVWALPAAHVRRRKARVLAAGAFMLEPQSKSAKRAASKNNGRGLCRNVAALTRNAKCGRAGDSREIVLGQCLGTMDRKIRPYPIPYSGGRTSLSGGFLTLDGIDGSTLQVI
jgi:hypothetical protein